MSKANSELLGSLVGDSPEVSAVSGWLKHEQRHAPPPIVPQHPGFTLTPVCFLFSWGSFFFPFLSRKRDIFLPFFSFGSVVSSPSSPSAPPLRSPPPTLWSGLVHRSLSDIKTQSEQRVVRWRNHKNYMAKHVAACDSEKICDEKAFQVKKLMTLYFNRMKRLGNLVSVRLRWW